MFQLSYGSWLPSGYADLIRVRIHVDGVADDGRISSTAVLLGCTGVREMTP